MDGYRNIIFAGGGSRCMWQLGFWEGAREAGLDLRAQARFVGSVSAGCAMATAAVLGRSREALELFKELTARNPANVHWRNLAPSRPGAVLPHAEMYRGALLTFLRDEDLAAFEHRRLAFLMARAPRWLGGAAAAALGIGVYSVEKKLRKPVHPTWAARLGFEPVVGFAHECRTTEEFSDLVLASSCVPPVLPGGRYRSESVLDGGLIDNVPVLLAEDEPGATLVLLSRRVGGPLPSGPARTYVQPSGSIAIHKFDYANPDGLQAAYDLGLEDGDRFARERCEAGGGAVRPEAAAEAG